MNESAVKKEKEEPQEKEGKVQTNINMKE